MRSIYLGGFLLEKTSRFVLLGVRFGKRSAANRRELASVEYCRAVSGRRDRVKLTTLTPSLP